MYASCNFVLFFEFFLFLDLIWFNLVYSKTLFNEITAAIYWLIEMNSIWTDTHTHARAHRRVDVLIEREYSCHLYVRIEMTPCACVKWMYVVRLRLFVKMVRQEFSIENDLNASGTIVVNFARIIDCTHYPITEVLMQNLFDGWPIDA